MWYLIHKIFSMVSFLTIVLFFSSTLVVELLFSINAIVVIKNWIVFPGLFILIPAIALTAISGNIIAKKSKKLELIKQKRKRMPIIAFNGLLILIPSALYLNILASHNNFDTTFYIIQGLELCAGATNIILMFLNIKESKKSYN